MTRPRTRACLTALAVVAALGASACSGDSGSSESGGTGRFDGIELTIMGWSATPEENATFTEIVGRFNAETGAEAKFVPQAEYDPALQAALASGDAPDVFYVDTSKVQNYVDDGILAPVPVEDLTDADDLIDPLVDAFTVEGEMYAVPKDYASLGLIYDAAAFREAGLTPPTTWDELAAAAEKLTTPKRAGLVSMAKYERMGAFLFQNDSGLVAPDGSRMLIEQGATEPLDFLTGMYRAGHAKTPAAVGAGWSGEALGKGLTAMALEGNWVVGALESEFPDREFGIAELPAGPKGPGSFLYSAGLGVPADAENAEASWAFVDYFTGPEGAAAWTEKFNAMPARASLSAGWTEKHPEQAPLVKTTEYGTVYSLPPGFGEVESLLNERLEALFAGELDAARVVEDVAKAGRGALGG
ncbi:MAG: extracellular solute-binding protein [Dermatophilaceae bacterium]